MRRIHFNKWRIPSFFFSGFLIIVSILFVIFKGFNLSIDFTGGIVIEFRQTAEEIPIEEVRETMRNLKIQDFSVQKTEDGITIIQIGINNKENGALLAEIIKETLNSKFTKTDIDFLKVDFVSPKIGKELAFKAIIAVLVSLIAVLFYISVRFEFIYSIGAILALLHDIILTIGFISIFAIPFDVSTIAAILTVVGYSINDSVVIFDRVRTNLKVIKEIAPKVIEISLNNTLSRTIITSFTTLLAIFAIILLGGSILRTFALIIFFGIVAGTFSSIFIAPIFLYRKKTEN